MTTIAGSGEDGWSDDTGAAAKFRHPSSVTMTSTGDIIVADGSNHRIRRISSSGTSLFIIKALM